MKAVSPICVSQHSAAVLVKFSACRIRSAGTGCAGPRPKVRLAHANQASVVAAPSAPTPPPVLPVPRARRGRRRTPAGATGPRSTGPRPPRRAHHIGRGHPDVLEQDAAHRRAHDAGQRAGRLLEPERPAPPAVVGRPATSVDSVGVARPWPITSSSERGTRSPPRRGRRQDQQPDGDAVRARSAARSPNRSGR